MKQTVYYLQPGGSSQFVTPRNRGLGMIRDARARNVKAYFGLWFGLFAFTLVWALIDLARFGLAGMQDSVRAQLVVLVAAVIFYLSSKHLSHHRTSMRVPVLPVTLSLITCSAMFIAVLVSSGPTGAAERADHGFWSAIQATQVIDTVSSSGNDDLRSERPLTGLGVVIHTLDMQGSGTPA